MCNPLESLVFKLWLWGNKNESKGGGKLWVSELNTIHLLVNPISAGVLENQDMLGGGSI